MVALPHGELMVYHMVNSFPLLSPSTHSFLLLLAVQTILGVCKQENI